MYASLLMYICNTFVCHIWIVSTTFDVNVWLLTYMCHFWYICVTIDVYVSLLIYMRHFWYICVTFDLYVSLVCCVTFDIYASPLTYMCLFWDTRVTFDVYVSLLTWCVRCLLITESPKTPSHYRYQIYTGLAVFKLRFLVFLCILRFRFLKFMFSTLQSRSCFQLANSCLLRGHEGSLLRIDILSFFFWFTDCYIFEVVCWVFSTLNMFSFVILSLFSSW